MAFLPAVNPQSRLYQQVWGSENGFESRTGHQILEVESDCFLPLFLFL